MGLEKPQAQLSRQWLVNALLKIMEEKAYGQITIQEIARRADLDRRTFYRHFKSKEEVLNYYVEDICKSYFEAFSAKQLFDDREAIRDHFGFLQKHLAFLRLLKANGLTDYLLGRYQYYAEKIYREIMPDAMENPNQRFALIFKVGGLWNVTMHWLEEDAPASPEAITENIMRLMEHGLLTYGEPKPSKKHV